MRASGGRLIALAAAGVGCLAAPPAWATDPIEVGKLPYIEIFSPTFFWNDEMDFVRTGSTNCPKGRAVTGGVSIIQGKASLRVLESYPDGESWVLRVVNRQKPDSVQSLQVRGFALCMLPAARKSSVMMTQQTRLLHASTKLGLTGSASATARQACPQGALVVSGGFGLDPAAKGSPSPRLEVSYPDPNGWNVRAVNTASGAEPVDGRAYAVCLGTKEGVDIRNFQTIHFVDQEVLVKAENGTARQTIGCGDGSYVLSGGTRTVKGRRDAVEVQESFPDSPTSWTLNVINRGDKRAGDATVRLTAVCIKK
jgi:hypothetical protein